MERQVERGEYQKRNLLFAVCILPLTSVFRKMRVGYMLGRVKVNNLCFMDDLKPFAKAEKESECFAVTEKGVSKDIGMENQ